MKHCAKKLLGLAFALALCLAVGGTALAETPESANVSDTPPEQEMLDYEPNVTTAGNSTTVDKFATDGYTVTIPTTVDVKSGENEGELTVNAQLKQYRTLKIGIESTNKWKLKYQGADAGTTTPEVGYTLKNEAGGGYTTQGMVWYYDESKHEINYIVTGVTSVDTANIPLSVNVTDPSQATMSGTYSDTLAFTFNITKQSVTYTINVYHQEMALTNNHFNRADNAPNYQALKMVDKVGTDGEPIGGAQPDEVYTYEYGFANGAPVGNPPETWTRPRPDGTEGEEDTRCWEDLTYALKLQENYDADKKDIVVNLNLVRKWCWLDVNGITNKENCTDCGMSGNQGSKIGSFVNIKVSDGKNWSGWYWYSTGDDYWGTFPYGTEFQLGLHRVKDGYAYDEDDSGNIAIYANNKLEYKTNPPISENGTTYRVYQGKLEGAPFDTGLYNTKGGGNVHDGAGSKDLPRYCYNPCYVNGITYYANGGGGGREDTNLHHGPHTTFKYTDGNGMRLAEPETTTGCNFTAPAGKVFAGWSTTPDYTAGQKLYDANVDVSSVTWPARPSTSHNDTLPTKDGQTECRVLYAIWGYAVDIKVQFENERGYTAKDPATLDFTDDELGGFGTAEEVGTQVVYPGAKLTLNAENQAALTEKIKAATMKATGGAVAPDDIIKKVWQLDSATVDETINSAKEVVIKVKRQRHMVNIISVLLKDDDGGITVPSDYKSAQDAKNYGAFKVWVNGSLQTADETDGVVSIYQCRWNYGASYSIDGVIAKNGYKFKELRMVQGTAPTEVGTNGQYSGTLTAKHADLGYFGSATDTKTYTGDTIYVVFKNNDSTTTGSTTPMPGPSRAPAKKALTLRYHANFDPNEELALDLDPNPLLDDMDDTFGFDPDPLPEDVDDALEEAVKTVTYQPGENVVLRNCMFKRGGYVFVGWNTEPDGTGRLYRVNGVPITDWAAGDTVDLYAQWEKPGHLKPVVDLDPLPDEPDAAAPAAPPEDADAAFGVDPAAQPDALDDAFSV